MEEMEQKPDQETQEYIFNQTMLRIKDPIKSLNFYTNILGMTLLKKLDFNDYDFSLYFLAYLRSKDDPVPENENERFAYTLSQKAVLELTHNWGTEKDEKFFHHDGNSNPRGFGHIGITVPKIFASIDPKESAQSFTSGSIFFGIANSSSNSESQQCSRMLNN